MLCRQKITELNPSTVSDHPLNDRLYGSFTALGSLLVLLGGRKDKAIMVDKEVSCQIYCPSRNMWIGSWPLLEKGLSGHRWASSRLLFSLNWKCCAYEAFIDARVSKGIFSIFLWYLRLDFFQSVLFILKLQSCKAHSEDFPLPRGKAFHGEDGRKQNLK